jgi:hypothetical protein
VKNNLKRREGNEATQKIEMKLEGSKKPDFICVMRFEFRVLRTRSVL